MIGFPNWRHLAISGLPAESRKKNFLHAFIAFIEQTRSVKMVRYWPRFLRVYGPRLVSVHEKAKKNLANTQPSRPHAWSITHIYMYVYKVETTDWIM